MTHTIYQVDAFTSQPFKGNPAAVCILEAMPSDSWLAAVASEMNLSETAFLLPQDDGWRLRWFTPKVEVPLCGHATLASAHILWETGMLPPDREARFHTLSGLLTARKIGGAWIEMDFPTTAAQPITTPPELGQILGAKPLATYDAGWSRLVELADEVTVRQLRPDFSAMVKPWDSVIVTAASDSREFDFVCRFFGPGVGINEDPVTGSAHCILGPFWAARLGKTELVSHQVSARGGVVKVAHCGQRTKISGQAVTVLKAELM